MDFEFWTLGVLSALGGVTFSSVLGYHFYKLLKKKSLKGKVAMITGASSGIGKALAFELYKMGCKVVLVARNKDALEHIKSEMLSMHIDQTEEPICFPFDVTEFDALPSIIEKLFSVVEKIDILVNNAGVSQRSNAMDTELSVDRKILDVNFLAPVYLTKLILPQMINRKDGTIVNICSLQSLIALPERSMYSSSKFALRAYSNSLRIELKDFNVHVLVVNPGYVDTNIQVNALTGTGKSYGIPLTRKSALSCEHVAKKIVNAIQMQQRQIELYDTIMSRIGVMMCSIFPSLVDKYLYDECKRAKKHAN